jgi:hypothetical protein
MFDEIAAVLPSEATLTFFHPMRRERSRAKRLVSFDRLHFGHTVHPD